MISNDIQKSLNNQTKWLTVSQIDVRLLSLAIYKPLNICSCLEKKVQLFVNRYVSIKKVQVSSYFISAKPSHFSRLTIAKWFVKTKVRRVRQVRQVRRARRGLASKHQRPRPALTNTNGAKNFNRFK